MCQSSIHMVIATQQLGTICVVPNSNECGQGLGCRLNIEFKVLAAG
jgi:hypothetical protein